MNKRIQECLCYRTAQFKTQNSKLKTYILSILFILVKLSLLFIPSLYSQSKQQCIEWKPIKGARGYRIQIRTSSHQTIIDQFVNTHTFPITKLKKGEYESRVAPLNVFQKPVVWSYWRPLKVLIVKKPKLNSTEEKIIVTEDDKQTITIKGNNFVEDTKVSVESQKNKLKVDKVKTNNSQNLSFSLDTKNAKQGYYDLKIENPKDKIITKKDFVRVVGKDEVVTLSPKENQKVSLQDDKPLAFQWSKNPHAKKYKFKISKQNPHAKELLKDETTSNSYTVKNPSQLEEGELTWEVQPITKDGKQGKITKNTFTFSVSEGTISVQQGDITITSPQVFYIDEDEK
jgi:hypothetical protein